MGFECRVERAITQALAYVAVIVLAFGCVLVGSVLWVLLG